MGPTRMTTISTSLLKRIGPPALSAQRKNSEVYSLRRMHTEMSRRPNIAAVERRRLLGN